MLIFIITFARTGGMILCETIGQHPALLTLNERADWREQIKGEKSAVIKIWNWEMFSPGEKKDIFDKYPDAKFISTLRDPKDQAASIKQMGQIKRDAKLFLTHEYYKDHPVWIEAAVQYKEFLIWLERHKNNPNLMLIDFEDLILKKQETFKKIFGWLELDMSADIRTYIRTYINNEPVKNYPGEAFSHSTKTKIGNYKDILTEWEIKKINSIFPMSAHVS